MKTDYSYSTAKKLPFLESFFSKYFQSTIAVTLEGFYFHKRSNQLYILEILI